MARILVVTRTRLEEHSGSSFHLRNMMECLKNAGHEIHCAIFSENIYDLPLTNDELKLAEEACDACDPHIVIADYSWMANVFDVVDRWVRKFVFVHDLRCRIVPCLQKIYYNDHFGWTEEREARLLRKAHVLMVLNDEDEKFCKRMAPDAQVIRIGIAMDPVLHDASKEIPGRCVYVCSGSKENEFAINWFHQNVWPKVVKEVPYAHLDIVDGFVKDLDDRYAKAQIAVVPHIMQGGLKIKTVEALAHGVHAVGSVCAFDGIGNFCHGHDDPDEMAHVIVFFIKNDFYRSSGGKDIYRYVKKYMTPQAAYGQLMDIFV